MKSPFLFLGLFSMLALFTKAEFVSAPNRPVAEFDGQSYPVYQLMTEVVPLESAAPSYPRAAKKEKRGGTVVVSALVNEKGRVKETRLFSTDAADDLNEVALSAVRKWKFPVMKSGPVPIRYVVNIPMIMDPEVAASKFHEIITDPHIFRKALGRKVLVEVDSSTGRIPLDVAEALKVAVLSEGIEYLPFPKEGVIAQSIDNHEVAFQTIFATIPLSGQKGGSSEFLVMVGQDGMPIGIYCYKYTNLRVAVAQATLVTKSRYTPATIQGVPVPMILQMKTETKIN